MFGIFSKDPNIKVAEEAYLALFALQHRGQESCGIVVNDDGVFSAYKDDGLVNDVFTERKLGALGEGRMVLGHVRYGSSKNKGRINAQPMVVNHVKGHIAIAHNDSL